MKIVNNTGFDINEFHDPIMKFGLTGELHEVFEDLLELRIYISKDGEKRIIVEMA